MSTTFYESPKNASPYEGERRFLSIDVTHHWCWFFEGNSNGELVSTVRVARDELPAILEALKEYLAAGGGAP